MVRVSVFLPRDQIARLRVIAQRERVPAAQLIRASLHRTLGGARPAPRGGFLR